MQVIAVHKQYTEPGKYSAMESSIAKDERHGSSTTPGLQHNQVFTNHHVKGTESPGHFDARFPALQNKQDCQAAHAGEPSKLIPPTDKRIQNRPQGRAEPDTRCNRSEHSAHRPPLNLIGITVPDSGQSDRYNSAASQPR